MLKPELLDNLPIEIIREHIFPYTYKPQPEFLLKDIKDFYSFRSEIYDLYTSFYIDYDNPTKIMKKISNDIFRYMNCDVPLIYGYSDKHYEFWRRLPFFHDKSELFLYNTTTELLKRYHIFTVVNIQLGLLRCEERESFIHSVRDIYNI